MPLVTLLRKHEILAVKNHTLSIKTIRKHNCDIEVLGGVEPRLITLRRNHKIEILPEVFIIAGDALHTNKVKLIIDAPRSIVITVDRS